MKINPKDIENLSMMNVPEGMRTTDKLYIKGKYMYKIFGDNSFIDEKSRNLDFLLKNKVPNSPEIYTILRNDEECCGYIMEYIKNAITFRQAISAKIPFEKKIQAIVDIYESLKYLHSFNICLGDIHSDNMLISDGKGYLIDLEEIRFPGDNFKFKQCYLVRPNNSQNKINIPSKYTDNVKLMICCLSLLLEKDLETLIDPRRYEINLESLYNDVILPLNNQELSSYFEELMNGEFTEYFSDFVTKSIYKKGKTI